MVLNAVAAVLAGAYLGANVEALAGGVSSFDGVRRRFEYHGEAQGVTVYDDYAHHPTEVSAVLGAARERMNAAHGGRVIAVFQPHLYSRTMNFAKEFGQALSLADEVVLMDIFGAREAPVDGVDTRIIAKSLTSPWHYAPDFSKVPQQVAEIARPGDMVLTIGAGTVTMLAPEVLLALQERED